MASNDDDDGVARARNAEIGRNYDELPYDPPANPSIDPEIVFAVAAPYGCIEPEDGAFSVLDLGCGAGRQLERLATQTRGRIVGVDIVEESCRVASSRVSRFGDRVSVLCGDLVELDAHRLGRFDLIYLVGVLYVTPAELQGHLLELVASCLKPRGVAVLSYYAGTQALLRDAAFRMARAAADPSLPARERVRHARDRIATVASRLGEPHRWLTQVTGVMLQGSDSLIFHEGLNAAFRVLETSSIESTLRRHGVHFFNYTHAIRFSTYTRRSRERALAADEVDFTGGGYHYAVFGKEGQP